MTLLTQEQLKERADNIKVGQVWKCLEDNRIVLVSMVRPKELNGYIFTGFEIAPYTSFALMDFVRYFEILHDPRKKGK